MGYKNVWDRKILDSSKIKIEVWIFYIGGVSSIWFYLGPSWTNKKIAIEKSTIHPHTFISHSSKVYEENILSLSFDS